MPKYYGCPCEGCGEPLTLKDDIVVCPDCGAPYHRTCYEKLGRCIHSPAHAAGYEWHFPYQDAELRTCPSCGERTLRSEETCRCCGAALPPETEADEQLNDRKAAQDEQHGGFDYERFYRQYEQQTMDPLHRNLQAAFGKDELIDGIPSSDWMTYIGTAAPAYLNDYSRMQLQHTKISLSFSALLFGPFYFFYRSLEARVCLSGRRIAAVCAHAAADDADHRQLAVFGPERFHLCGAGPRGVVGQLCAHAGARHVCQVVLPQERGGAHPAHPRGVPGRCPAQRGAFGTGRCELGCCAGVSPAADGVRCLLQHAAGPQSGCSAERSLLMRFIKEFLS